MKKIVLLTFLFSVQFIVAQNKIDATPIESELTVDNTIYSIAGLEEKPDFPGGIQNFYKFFKANFKLLEYDENIKGKIFVIFIIEKDGSLTDLKVLRDIGYGTGKEVIRVLKMSPKWIPGKQNGKLVRVLNTIPISIDNSKIIEPVNNKNIDPIKDKHTEK